MNLKICKLIFGYIIFSTTAVHMVMFSYSVGTHPNASNFNNIFFSLSTHHRDHNVL